MATIRRGVKEDAPAVLALIRELAAYEREPDAVVATADDLVRHGFGERPLFHVLVAEDEAEAPDPACTIVGFALYFIGFSTWTGAPVLYLEDLFVRPEHRKRGLGLSLMRSLAEEAVTRGCGRFVFQVLDWNEPAIQFYESLGATVLREWLTVRIDGEPLRRLAGAGSL
jgi:GNAT superfamily N-acetyltransferase